MDGRGGFGNIFFWSTVGDVWSLSLLLLSCVQGDLYVGGIGSGRQEAQALATRQDLCIGSADCDDGAGRSFKAEEAANEVVHSNRGMTSWVAGRGLAVSVSCRWLN